MTEKQVHSLALQTANWMKQNKYNWVDPYKIADIVTAICFVESTYNPKAKNSHSSAKGLMQMTDPAKKDAERWLGLPTASTNEMYNPVYNLKLGTMYFLHQYKRYKFNLKKSVIAYNQGHYNPNADGLDYWAKFQKAYKQRSPQVASFNPLLAILLVGGAIGTWWYYNR